MFKKNKSHNQMSFSSLDFCLPQSKLDKMKNTMEMSFYENVFCKIDEGMFEVLYSDKASRPNSPVNQIVGALTLKELMKWTFRELLWNMDYNILTRMALGLHDMSEEAVSESTIFLFLSKVRDYDNRQALRCAEAGEKSESLLYQVFKKLSDDAIAQSKASKHTIRIDSTFLDSNIRRYGRIQLLVEGLRRLWKILTKEDKAEYSELMSPYVKDDSDRFIYDMKQENSKTVEDTLAKVYTGLHLNLREKYGNIEEYRNIFERLFGEHVEFGELNIMLRKASELKSDSLQSPDDPQATFRNKRGQQHRGYLSQVSEIVDVEKGIAVITDVAVTPNNKDDSRYLADKIESYANEGVKEIHADGGYGSEAVDAELEKHEMKMYQSAIKGKASKVELTIIKTESDTFEVECPLQKKSAKKTKERYCVKFDMSKCRECPFLDSCPAGKNKGKHYFKSKDFLKQKRHKAINELTKEQRNIRSGSERTMFAMYYDRKHGKKMRVRGIFSMQRDSLFRAIAVNFKRLMNYCVLQTQILATES